MRKTVTQRTRQSLSHTVDTWRNHANIQKRFLLLGTKIVKRWRNQVMSLAIYTHVYLHSQVICVGIYSLSVGHWLRLGWLQVMDETVEHCRSSLRIFPWLRTVSCLFWCRLGLSQLLWAGALEQVWEMASTHPGSKKIPEGRRQSAASVGELASCSCVCPIQWPRKAEEEVSNCLWSDPAPLDTPECCKGIWRVAAGAP